MEIVYLGYSSFKLKGRKTSLVTDPYDDKVGKFPDVSADIVTISHNHDDQSQTKLISDVKKFINGPGEYEILEVSIIGLPSYCDEKKGEERGKNTIYVIEMDGVRVAHLGGLGHKLSEKEVDKLGSVDVLLVPVGGVYTINPEGATHVVKSIEPVISVPMSFKMPGMNEKMYGNLSTVDDFLKEIGLPIEKMGKLSVKSSEISEEQKVIVLEVKK